MKTAHKVAVAGRDKSQTQNKASKRSYSANIAQRYIEVRRLRKLISDAQSSYARL